MYRDFKDNNDFSDMIQTVSGSDESGIFEFIETQPKVQHRLFEGIHSKIRLSVFVGLHFQKWIKQSKFSAFNRLWCNPSSVVSDTQSDAMSIIKLVLVQNFITDSLKSFIVFYYDMQRPSTQPSHCAPFVME